MTMYPHRPPPKEILVLGHRAYDQYIHVSGIAQVAWLREIYILYVWWRAAGTIEISENSL